VGSALKSARVRYEIRLKLAVAVIRDLLLVVVVVVVVKSSFSSKSNVGALLVVGVALDVDDDVAVVEVRLDKLYVVVVTATPMACTAPIFVGSGTEADFVDVETVEKGSTGGADGISDGRIRTGCRMRDCLASVCF
jgi:hypothetical protein